MGLHCYVHTKHGRFHDDHPGCARFIYIYIRTCIEPDSICCRLKTMRPMATAPLDTRTICLPCMCKWAICSTILPIFPIANKPSGEFTTSVPILIKIVRACCNAARSFLLGDAMVCWLEDFVPQLPFCSYLTAMVSVFRLAKMSFVQSNFDLRPCGLWYLREMMLHQSMSTCSNVLSKAYIYYYKRIRFDGRYVCTVRPILDHDSRARIFVIYIYIYIYINLCRYSLHVS